LEEEVKPPRKLMEYFTEQLKPMKDLVRSAIRGLAGAVKMREDEIAYVLADAITGRAQYKVQRSPDGYIIVVAGSGRSDRAVILYDGRRLLGYRIR